MSTYNVSEQNEAQLVGQKPSRTIAKQTQIQAISMASRQNLVVKAGMKKAPAGIADVIQNVLGTSLNASPSLAVVTVITFY